jgi:hypothetical protein
MNPAGRLPRPDSVTVVFPAEHDGDLADADGKVMHQLRHRRISSRMRHDIRHIVGSQVVKMKRHKLFRPAGRLGKL